MRPSVGSRGLCSLLVLIALGCPGRRADAYVRSWTEPPPGSNNPARPFYWPKGCVPATIYSNEWEDKGGLSLDRLAKSVAAAAHAWSPSEVTCPGTTDGHPYLEIVPSLAANGSPPAIAWDSRNSIVIRTDMWTKSGKPDLTIDGKNTYAFDALAVTTVTARGDGHIVDADIEINAISKAWLDLDPGVSLPSGGQMTVDYYDLQNALTHEFGHFLGLDHTCYNPSGKQRPVDESMPPQPVPDCATAPFEVTRTVMFDRATPEQTSKRYLSDDDKRAVCEIYKEPLTCEVDQPNDGCAAAGPSRGGGLSGGWGGLAAFGLGALAFVAARRRGRARAKG